MKVLLLIGILVCMLLIYIIYKNSKGVDVLNNFYNVIENYDDLHNNTKGAPLDDLNTRKMGKPTNQYSTMNKETSYLAGGGKIDMIPPEKPKNKLSQEEKNKLKKYLTKSDKLMEVEVDEKLQDRLDDPSGFFDGNVKARSFLEVEKRGLADEPAFKPDEPKVEVELDKSGEAKLNKSKKAEDEVDEEYKKKQAEDKAASDANIRQMKSLNSTSEGDYKQTDIGGKISKCNALTSCDELTGKDCGYCADDGFNKSYFGIGSKDGPLTAVCKPNQWTLQKSKCFELKDKAKCALANDDCANIPEEHKNLCGFCPSTGKVMPYKIIKGNKLVKYKSDSCNYNWKAAKIKGPILVGDECIAFSKNNPCITPYHATGPHRQSCLAKLWKGSGCGGEKPFMRKMDELTADNTFNTGSYKLIKAKMDKQKKDMNANDIGTVMRSTLNCENREADINPCEFKFYGGTYDPAKHKVAREYCRRKLWKESGCGEDGHKNPDLLKGSALNKITMMSSKQYSDSISKLPEIANTPVPPNKHNIRKQASLDCYGREPPEPSPLKAGFFVRYDRVPGLKLWGYLMEMNNMANWRIMWVAKETSSGRINRKDYIVKGSQSKEEQQRRLDKQRYEFGWPGYKNAEDSRMANFPDYIPNQYLTVVAECEPGVTMCGNSCMSIFSNLKDNYPSPQDCIISKWGGWSSCNKECKEGGTPGTQTRARYILAKAKRGGKSCPPDKLNGKPNPYYYETKQCVENVECYNKNFNDESGEMWDEDGRHKRGFVDAKGKRVTHVIISHSNYLHIQELEIYDETNTNVARINKGGRAFASDTGWGSYPNQMIDGRKDSGQRWPNSVHTRRGGNRWLRVNIRPTNVTRIIVYNRPDCCQSRLDGARMVVWNGRRKVKQFYLDKKRKQIFHLWDKNVFNKTQRRGRVVKKCTELTVPMSLTEQEINTAKNIKFGGYNNATIMKDYGNGTYQVRLSNGQIRNVPRNWIQSQMDNFVPNMKEGFKIGEKVKVAKNDNGRRQSKDGSCMETVFKKSDTNPDGGDCDWHSYKWYGWGSRNWPVKKCAEECLKNPNCNRFTFGKSNRWGGWGLGCRISTGGNGGFCPITTDRYKANGWSWWGNSNYWGGDVYDKKGTKPVNAYKWIGDFQDKHKWNWYWGPKLGRDSRYAGRVARWAPGNDAMACSYRCRNYKYFGLQGWGRCYCGNKLETGTQCHDVGRPWWRWWSWYWPWGPRDCNKGNVHRSASNRGRRAWYWYSWYGGYRTKIYKTPKGQVADGDQGWRYCSRENQMCNPGRGATGLRPRYRREGSDWRNNYWYRCSSGSSYATYNANTLNNAQKRYARRWGAKRNYSCVHGCWGRCYRRGSGALRGRADRYFAGWAAGRSTSSRPALIRYGSGNNWTTKGNRGSIRCDNTTFGDPRRGVRKYCQWKPA